MTLELNDREAEILGQLIKRRIEEIGPEIHHTDARNFRDELRKDEDCLRAICNRLTACEVR